MSKKLTIVYVTCRREPMFQWFAETLISQYPDGVVTDQIIFIDSFIHHEDGRTEKLAKIVNGKKQNYELFTLLKICLALNVSPNEIIEKEEFINTQLNSKVS